jgi:hypothetical protein
VGAGADVELRSNTITRKLTLLDLPAGALEVNFAERRITVDGDDMSGKLDLDESDWWDARVPGLVPGANSVQVSHGPWTVSFHDADE